MPQRKRGPSLNHGTTSPARGLYFPEAEDKITVIYPADSAVREFPKAESEPTDSTAQDKQM